ncbi:MAG: hypothetical protein ACLQU4_22335, partial [Limisphaerales bacterium]
AGGQQAHRFFFELFAVSISVFTTHQLLSNCFIGVSIKSGEAHGIEIINTGGGFINLALWVSIGIVHP